MKVVTLCDVSDDDAAEISELLDWPTVLEEDAPIAIKMVAAQPNTTVLLAYADNDELVGIAIVEHRHTLTEPYATFVRDVVIKADHQDAFIELVSQIYVLATEAGTDRISFISGAVWINKLYREIGFAVSGRNHYEIEVGHHGIPAPSAA